MKKPSAYTAPFVLALLFGFAALPWSAPAQAEWQAATEVGVDAGPPQRSRRSPDATVALTLTNNSDEAIEGPARTLLTLTGSVSGVAGATQNADGNWVLDVSSQFDPSLGAGASAQLTIRVLGGGRASFGVTGIVEVDVEDEPPPRTTSAL